MVEFQLKNHRRYPYISNNKVSEKTMWHANKQKECQSK